MDQQTLGCKYPIIHAPDLDCSSSMNSANPGNTASMLRSHSDSRIHIPHFLSVKDKDFHTNLSSLFENVAGFNGAGQQHSLNDTMDNSSGVERKLSLTKPGLDRNKSAFELCSKNTVNEEPTSALRKTSSVANYNIEDHSSIPRQGSSSFLSSAFHFVTGNNSSLAIQKIPEEEDGGLKMMVTGSSFSPSALTSSGSLHADPIVHNNPTHLSGNNLADIDALTEKNKPRTNGMFGIFNRGFLGKQVMSDQESQYRYIFGVEKY